jgi:hypothetical protein
MPINGRSASVPGKRAGTLPRLTRLMQSKEGKMKVTLTQSTNAKSHELDRFVSEQNIVRYSRLLDPEPDASRRRAILGLLKREFDKLRE